MRPEKDLRFTRSRKKVILLFKIRNFLWRIRYKKRKWGWLSNLINKATYPLIRWCDEKILDFTIDDINHSPSLLKEMDE